MDPKDAYDNAAKLAEKLCLYVSKQRPTYEEGQMALAFCIIDAAKALNVPKEELKRVINLTIDYEYDFDIKEKIVKVLN